MDCTNKKLQLVFGDLNLGVKGENFHYLFSYNTGGLESIVIDGKEWLYRAPKPTFWRATTDNDRGSRFPLKSGMWLSADMFIACVGSKVWIDGEEIPFPNAPANNVYDGSETADTVSIMFTYQTITVPSTKVEVKYTVNAAAEIKVDVHYYGQEGLPQLPVFGMRFIMPTKAIGFKYEGLSGETYPDRMAGGIPGVYEVCGMPVTKYMVPQDCGMHMGTKWVEIYRNTTKNNADKDNSTFGLKFAAADKDIAFTCLPYTAEELENATHHEELPAARRCVVTVLGAVRGVGGIDSWGADVESAYHIDAAKDIEYSFVISGVK